MPGGNIKGVAGQPLATVDYECDSGAQSAISAETRNRALVTQERVVEDLHSLNGLTFYALRGKSTKFLRIYYEWKH